MRRAISRMPLQRGYFTAAGHRTAHFAGPKLPRAQGETPCRQPYNAKKPRSSLVLFLKKEQGKESLLFEKRSKNF
jgi:hypothetical protein